MSNTDERVSIKISVISPGRRQGCTTIALLLGLCLARTQGKSVCFTHAGTDNNSISSFLGQEESDTRTNSLEQVSKLIEFGTITREEIIEYTDYIAENFNLMNTASEYLSQEESTTLLHKLLDLLDFDYVVIDIDTELTDDITQDILKKSDMVLVVMEQSVDMLHKLERWKNSEYYDVIDDVGELFVINKFDENVSTMLDFTKRGNLDKRFCTKISNTYMIKKMSNEGKLASIFTSVLKRSVPVFEMSYDLRSLVKMLCDNLGTKFIDWTEPTKEQIKRASKEKIKPSRSGRVKSIES